MVLFSGAILAADSLDEPEKNSEEWENSAGFVRQIIEEYLVQTFSTDGREVEIRDIRVPKNVQVPDEYDRYAVVSPTQFGRDGRLVLELQFEKNTFIIKRIKAIAFIETYSPVVMALSKIYKGQTIQEDQVILDKRKISDLPTQICTDLADVVGMRAGRDIRAGDYFLKTVVERNPDVHKGDTVIIKAQSDIIEVITKGVAKEEGSLGDQIQVLNLKSNRVITARVIDPKTVAVDF